MLIEILVVARNLAVHIPVLGSLLTPFLAGLTVVLAIMLSSPYHRYHALLLVGSSLSLLADNDAYKLAAYMLTFLTSYMFARRHQNGLEEAFHRRDVKLLALSAIVALSLWIGASLLVALAAALSATIYVKSFQKNPILRENIWIYAALDPTLPLLQVLETNYTCYSSPRRKRGEDVIIALGATERLITQGRTYNCVTRPKACISLTTQGPTHIGVFGPTGSGKTTLAKLLASLAQNSVRILVIDPHGEYNIGLKVKPQLNPPEARIPLVLKGEQLADIIISYMKRLYSLGPRQEYLLRTVFKQIIEESGANRDVLVRPNIIAKRLLELDKSSSALSLSAYMHDFASKIGSLDLGLLFSKQNITIDLAQIRDIEVKKAIVEIVLASIYSYYRMQGETDRPHLLLIVDEAHELIPRGKVGVESLRTIIAEARKYGIIVLLVSQTPNQIDEIAISNIRYKILLKSYDLNTIKQVVSVDFSKLKLLLEKHVSRDNTCLIVDSARQVVLLVHACTKLLNA